MSKWMDAEEEDVDFNKTDQTIDVMYETDEWGNNYVSIPIEHIIKLLEKIGYRVKSPRKEGEK